MSKKDRFGLKGNTIAGTFRVDEVVAEGGFGVVYRAFHLHFRSPVALKCLKIPGELSQRERTEFLEQFRHEAEIQFHLSASLPNIVRPLHVDAVSSESGEFVPMMALEWLEGLSLEKIIEQRTFQDLPPLPLDETLEMISPAAQALHEAHNFEIDGERVTVIHRDIKPDNLFVTEIGGKKVVKILDFGISKVRRAATQLAGKTSQTDAQSPFSPAYGAPEQWAPKRFGQTGAWTDVWGLALTLVEIIKGDAVVVGDHQAMMGTVLDPQIRPSPRNEGVNVSDEVESVFLKALSLDPRYRYQSVRAFWDALSAAITLSPQPVGYNETPSGRRIPLPAMRPPTPWTPPHKRLLADDPTPLQHLPPMMAPAALSRTLSEEEPTNPESSSYPMNPHSDLQPVPAAPTSWDHFDPEIPPICQEDERKPLHEAPSNPLNIQPITEPIERTPLQESSVQLELQPTSTFPEERKSSPHAWSDYDPSFAAHSETFAAHSPEHFAAHSPEHDEGMKDEPPAVPVRRSPPPPPSSRGKGSDGARGADLGEESPRRRPPPPRRKSQAARHGDEPLHSAPARPRPPPPPRRRVESTAGEPNTGSEDAPGSERARRRTSSGRSS